MKDITNLQAWEIVSSIITALVIFIFAIEPNLPKPKYLVRIKLEKGYVRNVFRPRDTFSDLTINITNGIGTSLNSVYIKEFPSKLLKNLPIFYHHFWKSQSLSTLSNIDMLSITNITQQLNELAKDSLKYNFQLDIRNIIYQHTHLDDIIGKLISYIDLIIYKVDGEGHGHSIYRKRYCSINDYIFLEFEDNK